MTSPPFTLGACRTAQSHRGHQIQEPVAFVTSTARMSRCWRVSGDGALPWRSGAARRATWASTVSSVSCSVTGATEAAVQRSAHVDQDATDDGVDLSGQRQAA